MFDQRAVGLLLRQVINSFWSNFTSVDLCSDQIRYFLTKGTLSETTFRPFEYYFIKIATSTMFDQRAVGLLVRQVIDYFWYCRIYFTLWAVWPDWAIYWTFGQLFKAFGYNYFTQISHILKQNLLHISDVAPIHQYYIHKDKAQLFGFKL